MNKKVQLLAWSLLALYTQPSLAAGQITSASAQPNPAFMRGNTGPQVDFTVHVNMGAALAATCEVIITPGDGGKMPRMLFGQTNPSTQTVHYVYREAGTYRARVEGFGTGGCGGGPRDITVTVRAAGTTPAAGTAPAAAAAPTCPPGWNLVPTSVNGARYSCTAQPPQAPLACQGGTKYFTANGVIGCR